MKQWRNISSPQLVNPGFLNHQFNSTFKQLGVQQTLLEQNPQDSKDTKQPPYIPYKSNGLMFPAQVQ